MAATQWNPLYPGILIDGDITLFHKASNCLNALASLSIGHDLLSIISKRTQGIGMSGAVARGVVCVIRRGEDSLINRFGGALAYRTNEPHTALKADLSNASIALSSDVTRRRSFPGKRITLAGTGTASVAMFDPDKDFSKVLGMMTPAYVALGHELCHCMHNMSGDTNRHRTDAKFVAGDTFIKHEEARTVGIGIYANTRISENAIRRESKLPLRTYYAQPGDCDDLKSVLSA